MKKICKMNIKQMEEGKEKEIMKIQIESIEKMKEEMKMWEMYEIIIEG